MNKMASNPAMMMDLYELTMANGYYLDEESRNTRVAFDVFFRRNPDQGGFSVFAGLEQIVDYLDTLHFDKEDVDYLRSLHQFDERFLRYLEDFRFHGDVYAFPEGSVIYPGEPIITVVADIVEAQIIETEILAQFNHQSLIATKAARVKTAAGNDAVMEFGLRRAQGADAGTLGARAAVIGGCAGTSNVLCAKKYGVPALGTHAHSWIMSFDSEYEAFETYARLYPDNATLLVDTYDTLKSGVPNAIKVFTKLREEGKMPKKYGIRLDSGDLAYLSKQARKMLDDAGFPQASICASSDLDEYLID